MSTDQDNNSLGLTDAAADQLKILMAKKEESIGLRIVVDAGGCYGFQYNFKLTDAVSDDDEAFESHGLKIIVDKVSLPFVTGAVVDFKQELIGASFTLQNPQASSSCGCGTSFSV